ncbi:MAG: hypothetical protein AAFP16_07555 [Pseudomonadota bacterium]
MTGIQRTLLAILAFLAIAIGTFIYFIAHWDSSRTTSIGAVHQPVPVSVQKKSRGLGQRPSPALSTRTTT